MSLIQNDTRGFKRKTIIKNIRNKVREWVKTIDDENLRKEILDDYILTGGAIASMLQGNLPNDYDIYFKTPPIAKRVADYYLAKYTKETSDYIPLIESIIENNRVRIVIKSAGIAGGEEDNLSDYQYFESLSPEEVEKYFDEWKMKKDTKYGVALISSNAITLNDGIQIVMRFIGPPETIHKSYDYVHCTNWYTESDGLVLNQAALESILAKELRYVGSLYPVCSMFRIKKFIKRGWNITAGEIFKIAYDISKIDLSDINVLREQLVGVDTAYFREIIGILEKHYQDNDKELDRTYLYEVVNRVFDDPDFNEIVE